VKILTGNDLGTGGVIWWTGEGWSRHIEHAVDIGVEGEAIAVREEAARRVNGSYVIQAERTEAGPRPARIKDRIRAVGPTVRADLALARPASAGRVAAGGDGNR
jgi:hypothetical protein